MAWGRDDKVVLQYFATLRCDKAVEMTVRHPNRTCHLDRRERSQRTASRRCLLAGARIQTCADYCGVSLATMRSQSSTEAASRSLRRRAFKAPSSPTF